MKPRTKIALWASSAIAAVVGLIWYEEKKSTSTPQPSIPIKGGSPQHSVPAMPAGVVGPYTELSSPFSLQPGNTYLLQAPGTNSATFNMQIGKQSPLLTFLGSWDVGIIPQGWPNQDAGARIAVTYNQAAKFGVKQPPLPLTVPGRVYATNGQSS